MLLSFLYLVIATFAFVLLVSFDSHMKSQYWVVLPPKRKERIVQAYIALSLLWPITLLVMASEGKHDDK
jgi:hypothetical protein